MKKQIISIILMLTVLMSILSLTVAASETVTLTVSEVTANPGDEVAVTVSVSNNPGLASLKFEVAYDSVLTLTDITFNSAFGAYVTAPEPYKNPEPITMISPLEDNTANGVFVTLTFKVAETAEYGHKAQISLSYSEEDIFDGGYNDIPVSVVNGSVTVVCPHKNTVNIPEIAPGTTTVGYTAGVYCNDCSKFISGHEEIPATGDLNAPKIIVSDASASAGSSVSVNISIANNPGVAYLALSLNYDTSVFKSVTVKNGSLFSDLDNAANLIWSGDSDVTADGVLCTLTFEIAEDAPDGSYDISAIFREGYNYDNEEVAFNTVKGSISVTDFVYGDANGDGKVNGRDVLLLRKYMANYNYDTNKSDVEVSAGADANGDGKINGRDVLLMRKYMANYDYDTGSSTVVLGPQ